MSTPDGRGPGEVPVDETLREGMREVSSSSSGLRPGRSVDRYVILERVGAGGMGVVYRAYDPKLRREVALKRLHLDVDGSDGDEAEARLLREAQAMAQLNHPNVIAVYDVDRLAGPSGGLYIAMEFVEGPALQTWMQPTRPWAEIVPVFLQAGRGLEAAHRVGLVHRDFKPANVIVGDDGLVRVMDFGLARGTGSDSHGAVAIPRREGDSEEADPLSSPLTEAGTVMGTVAYMAPEQHRGRATDARTDQYAFCVTLFEALTGQRPFSGAKPLAAKLSGMPQPPAERKVPRWIWAVVERGLRPEGAERFRDMGELLAALDADPSVRRRRWMIRGVASVALVGAAVAVVVRPGVERCSGGEAMIDSAWFDRRDEVQAAVVENGGPMGAPTWQRIEVAVDDYATQWKTMHREACEATERREQSERVLDLRVACLGNRLGRLQSLVEVLANADRDTALRAVPAVVALPNLEQCADAQTLAVAIPLPSDPQVRARIEEVAALLDRSEALRSAGQYEAALDAAMEAGRGVPGVGYLPIEARHTAQLARVQASRGRFAEAVDLYERAVSLSVEARDDEAMPELLSSLAYLVGSELAQAKPAQAWARQARAFARRVDPDGAKEARVLQTEGQLALATGHYAEATRLGERALPILERELGEDSIHVSAALSVMGRAAHLTGDADGGLELLRRSHATLVRALGDGHPEASSSLVNLAIAEAANGLVEQAVADLSRAAEDQAATLGPAHPELASTFLNLGATLYNAGRRIEARPYYERALEISRANLGEDHPKVAVTRTNLGLTFHAPGDYAQAVPHHRRAVETLESVEPRVHMQLGWAYTSLGQALAGDGQAPEARDAFRKAIGILEHSEDAPMWIADARLGLARVLLSANGSREEARDHARVAREIYANAGPTLHRELGEADALLDELRE